MENFSTRATTFEGEFEGERSRRRLRYPELSVAIESGLAGGTTLCQEGLLRKPRLLDRSKVLALGDRVDNLVRRMECLGRIRHHRRELECDSFANGETFFLNPAEIENEEGLARECSSVTIRDPFLNLPESIQLALHPRIIGVASSYLGCIPVLSYIKIVKTFTSGFGPVDTQYFHRDIGSYWILKVFIYLNDVDTDGGPFCYARKSHITPRENDFGSNLYIRFADEKVVEMFGNENVVECTGTAGDVWFAETLGFHKGKRPRSAPRRIIIATFCIEKEKGFAYNPIKIKTSDLASLTPLQRAVCSELEVVPGY